MTKDSRKPYRRRSSSNNYDRSHKKSYGKKRTNQNKPEQKQQEEGFFSCVFRFAKGVFDFGKIVAPAVGALIKVTVELDEKGYLGSPIKSNATNESESRDNNK